MSAGDAPTLWRVQLALEGKAVDPDGRLVRVPCPDPDELDTCYVARYPDGRTEIVFADSAPEEFVRQAPQIPVEQYFTESGPVFAPKWTVQRGWFHTYQFASAPPITAQPADVERRGSEHFAAIVEGATVAEAMSSRTDDHAAELWVRTAETHRRRGYATQVATAWARAVLGSGKVAFYSHLHANSASRALARHLRVEQLFELIAISV